jgi:hypothetical protein
MQYQLRIYTVKPGKMSEWQAEWKAGIRPLRERLGFKVIGAWTIEEKNQFVWVLGYAGNLNWEEADSHYYASPDRTSLVPDPARHLAGTEKWPMLPISP